MVMKTLQYTLLALFTFSFTYSQNPEILLNGTVSAENNQIKNIQAPTDPGDAVNMSFLMELINEIQSQIDMYPPVINLFGEELVYINQFASFQDPGAIASDVEDGDLTSEIVIIGEVDTQSVGIYGLAYNVVDSHGNNAIAATRTVTVLDNTNPELSLVGDFNITWEGGIEYIDPGYNAIDAVDGDISEDVIITIESAPANTNSTITNIIDVSVLGDYVLLFSITDEAGNTISLNRTVTVIDTTPPEIIYFGDTNIQHPQHTPFMLDEFQLIDTIDGDITSQAVFSYYLAYSSNQQYWSMQSLDTDRAGTWLIKVTATDSSGNILEETQITQVDIYCTPEPGIYTINMFDSYGDGWQTGIESATNQGITVTYMLASGEEYSQQVVMCSQWDSNSADICTPGSYEASATFEVPEGTVLLRFSFEGDYYGEISWNIVSPQNQELGSYIGTDFANGFGESWENASDGLIVNQDFPVSCSWGN